MDQAPAPTPIGKTWRPPQPKQSRTGFAKAAVFVAGAGVGFLIGTLLLIVLVASALASLFNSFTFHF